MCNEMSNSFCGPLFLVGMPRSGTKLLRTILNEHPAISIAHIETEFLPFWVKKWRTFGDLSLQENFFSFYEKDIRLPYFAYMQAEAELIKIDDWYDACNSFDAAGVFEALLRNDTGAKLGNEVIWGDKSPSYVRHITLLKQLYPAAKFIHIIRDVRDYCVSMNSAWGKNMMRAAQRWANDIEYARQQGELIPEDYIEVRYEDLLCNPGEEIQRICNYLGVDYDTRMLSLSIAPENLGETKGERTINRGNTGKYKSRLSRKIRNRIEMIAIEQLRSLNYPVGYNGASRKLGRTSMLYYQVIDGFQLVRYGLRRRGVSGELAFHWRYFRCSGNRSKNHT